MNELYPTAGIFFNYIIYKLYCFFYNKVKSIGVGFVTALGLIGG